MVFGMAKAKLAFGVAAELELAVMQEVMVSGALCRVPFYAALRFGWAIFSGESRDFCETYAA